MKSQGHKTGRRADGFTLVELLVVIGIIGILLSILVPTVNVAIKHSKVASMRATLHAISTGLDQFRNDFGSYPDSEPGDPSVALSPAYAYRGFEASPPPAGQTWNTGAHRLAEALFGLDNLGYQPNHYYNYNGAGEPIVQGGALTKRWGPYVSVENVKLGPLSVAGDTIQEGELTYSLSPQTDWEKTWGAVNRNNVLLDTFNASKPRPIVYFKANTRGRTILTIYDFRDNYNILYPYGMMSPDEYLDDLPDVPTDTTWSYRGATNVSLLKCFPYYIWNHQSEGMNPWFCGQPAARPHHEDSFILMTAGNDGQFGTEDDVCNFELKK